MHVSQGWKCVLVANCHFAIRRRDALSSHIPRHIEAAEIEKGKDVILAIVGVSIASVIQREAEKPADGKKAFGLIPWPQSGIHLESFTLHI